jgi:hypothetical protein
MVRGVLGLAHQASAQHPQDSSERLRLSPLIREGRRQLGRDIG